jgi:hypothetical protein
LKRGFQFNVICVGKYLHNSRPIAPLAQLPWCDSGSAVCLPAITSVC